LRDPRTQEVRYVGKTVNPRGRLKVHVHAARRGKSWRVSRWIRELLTEGIMPQWDVLEIVQGNAAACERERYWIETFAASGARLVNLTAGGDGAPGCQMPESHRKARREYMKKRWQDPEYRARTLRYLKSYAQA